MDEVENEDLANVMVNFVNDDDDQHFAYEFVVAPHTNLLDHYHGPYLNIMANSKRKKTK